MSFALDPVWPPMFRSRTCDPTDPCFMGRVGGEANRSHAPVQASIDALCGKVKWSQEKQTKPGIRLFVGTYAWRVWATCKETGPQTTSDICALLGIGATEIPTALKRLLDADVLRKQRGGGRGRQLTYFVGEGPVVEVPA